ncbi:hypothetical protein K1719_028204 [Acacia pycnantha]|nr:hypothetical protein K1719_028204 [Acacia pycnantha]
MQLSSVQPGLLPPHPQGLKNEGSSLVSFQQESLKRGNELNHGKKPSSKNVSFQQESLKRGNESNHGKELSSKKRPRLVWTDECHAQFVKVVKQLGKDEQPDSNLCTDGLKDYFINSDFLKVLMDENLCQIVTRSPFNLPNLPDDNAWEQLLLDSPFTENEDSNMESDKPTTNGMEIEPAICETLTDKFQNCVGLMPEMDKTQKSGL